MRRAWVAHDGGFSAVEAVIITPAVVALMLFVVALGRVVDARGEVYGAARDAARAASFARDYASARNAAIDVANGEVGAICVGDPDIRVTGDFGPDGLVTVEVICQVNTSGLDWFPLPVDTVTGTSTAPLEQFKRYNL